MPLQFEILLVVSEIFNQIITVSPVLFDLYPELEIYFHIHHPFDLITGRAAYLFQHGSLLSDDNSLMRVFLADDRSVDITDTSVFSLLHLINGYSNPVGNLLIQTAQGFLPYQLRHNLAHGLICHGILIIILRAIGQILENLLNQRVCIVSIQGRYRHNLIEIIQLPVGIDKNQNLFPLYCIRFVDYKVDAGGYWFLIKGFR